jgi:hypothetical protein
MPDDFGEWGDGLPIGPAPDDAGEWGDGLPAGPPKAGPGPTPDNQANDFIAEILIGDVVVWSARNALPQQTLTLDVSGFEGIFEVTFRIRGLP